MKQKYGRLSICLSCSHRRQHAALTGRNFRAARLRQSVQSFPSLRSLLRQVYSLFQSEFSTQRDLVFLLQFLASFRFLRPSSSCSRLLHRLLVISTLTSIFPAITCSSPFVGKIIGTGILINRNQILVKKYVFLIHLISNFPFPCQGLRTRRWGEYFPPPLLGGK